MIEVTVNRLNQLVERFAMLGQEFEVLINKYAAAQLLPDVAAMTNEQVEIGRANFDEAGPVVFYEIGIYAAPLVSKRVLLPQATMKAECAARRPSVTRKTHTAFAHQQ